MQRARQDRPAIPPPGTPHPDPALAARGWKTCEHPGHGLYIRDPQAAAGVDAPCRPGAVQVARIIGPHQPGPTVAQHEADRIQQELEAGG
jgi:hypothetical protein